MSITEIEAALSELRPEELEHVEKILLKLRQQELADDEERALPRFPAVPVHW
ncbi:MAG: hypothetical protein WCP06_00130 [Verrucomicrobiota bacterium]